jgi:hypothetical protein
MFPVERFVEWGDKSGHLSRKLRWFFLEI